MCALNVECAEPVSKTQPSLSDASEAGMSAGRAAFTGGMSNSKLRTIVRAIAVGAVCGREKDPYIETLLEWQLYA